MNGSDDSSRSSVDSDVAFAFVDFKGVNFDDDQVESVVEVEAVGGDPSNSNGDVNDNDNNNQSDNNSVNSDGDTKKEVLLVGNYGDHGKVGGGASLPIMDQSTKLKSSNDNKNNDLNQLLMDGCKSLSMGNSSIHSEEKIGEKSALPYITFDKISSHPCALSDEDKVALDVESNILLNECTIPPSSSSLLNSNNNSDRNVLERVRSMSAQLCNGEYIDVLSGPTVELLLTTGTDSIDEKHSNNRNDITVSKHIRDLVVKYCTTAAKCVEVELVAVAALNLFLQVNYTGPSLHHGGAVRPGKEHPAKTLIGINPHELFSSQLNVSQTVGGRRGEESTGDDDVVIGEEGKDKDRNDEIDIEPVVDAPFHNSVLAELSVEGEWPCPVCKYPYFLLLARSILLPLADPNRPDWSHSILQEGAANVKESVREKVIIRKEQSNHDIQYSPPSKAFVASALHLSSAQLWSARASVAHVRLLQADEPSTLNLWDEARSMFQLCKEKFCDAQKYTNQSHRQRAAKILLEYGLSEHHFDVNKKGKPFFQEALQFAELDVEVTGAEGRRTKYQQKATAQMLVRAKPTVSVPNTIEKNSDKTDNIGKQFIDHQDETILLDKVKYVEKEDNTHFELSILQQTVLLALCLDVKNKNPMDGLTAEEMGAFLERVLQQHDDWMVYATGLLERAWLECERNHTRERAILQIQALADQHSNRLTLTQSTFEAAVENSAPPQDRLRYIHQIVYPPRWAALCDLAERYAKMGIVTSAAELFEEIELWDEVVECYRRAGKENKAEQVVRKRLLELETPRMWAALGDITKDPTHYERALEVSKGKYSGAYIALGKYYSERGDFAKAVEHFKDAVDVKPLSPNVWFQLGALSMRLKDWSTALKAFTEVVQQEPEEGDAWANVAAIHMHNKEPSEAYPALNESLKLNRNNWRVWISKLYTCMDLKKYDEAIQACLVLIDFKCKRNASEGIPSLEEKVIRGIVGGVVLIYQQSKAANDAPAIESSKRSLSRVRELLSQLESTMKLEPWLFETSAFFHESVGCDDLAIDNLMKEYRALQSIRGWETDKAACPKLCEVISQIAPLKLKESNVEELKKFKFLVQGVVKKIQAAYFDHSKLPITELDRLDDIIQKIEDNKV